MPMNNEDHRTISESVSPENHERRAKKVMESKAMAMSDIVLARSFVLFAESPLEMENKLTSVICGDKKSITRFFRQLKASVAKAQKEYINANRRRVKSQPSESNSQGCTKDGTFQRRSKGSSTGI